MAAEKSSRQADLQKFVQSYETRARPLVAAATESDDVDPHRIHQLAQAALDELREAEDSDGTIALLEYPKAKNVLWRGVIAELLDQSQAESAKPTAQVRPTQPKEDETIGAATTLAESERRRVSQAVESFRSESDQYSSLRQHIFGDRKLPSSKSGWATEIRTLQEKILALGDAAPPAFPALLPRLEVAAEAISRARAQPAGRPRSPEWSPAALQAAIALKLALNDLLAWAAAHASDRRNASMQRRLAPKRRADTSREAEPVVPPEPAAPAAPDPADPAAAYWSRDPLPGPTVGGRRAHRRSSWVPFRSVPSESFSSHGH